MRQSDRTPRLEDEPTLPVPPCELPFYERTRPLPVFAPPVPARSAAPRRSIGVAYVLWLVTGALGVHQFYLGRDGWGLAYLVLLLLAPLTLLLSLVPLALLLVVDLVAIPAWTRHANRRLAGGR